MSRSLRTRILIAAFLWSGGLLGLTHFLFAFAARHHPSILHLNVHYALVTAMLLLVAGLLIVRGALSRVDDLREQLAAVREGKAQRISGKFPSEVQPLVTELNALLDHRDETVRRALAKAADLAHGLKTPLAVMAHEVERHGDMAAIGQQIDRMQRQIDFHLAHARAAGSGATLGARSNVSESVDALIRTLQRLHAARGLTFDARVTASHAVRVQREDLEEMLGNLLDNACKWARTKIAVASMIDGANLIITVDDDGPGIEPSLRDAVLQRGVRADEAAPGTGLGLAIVRDLAEVYGGVIAIEESMMGGVSAKLTLPYITTS